MDWITHTITTMASTAGLSSLGRQLAALQQASGQRQAKGRDSLLFGSREAEDVDLETIAGMGANGFAQLVARDARLKYRPSSHPHTLPH